MTVSRERGLDGHDEAAVPALEVVAQGLDLREHLLEPGTGLPGVPRCRVLPCRERDVSARILKVPDQRGRHEPGDVLAGPAEPCLPLLDELLLIPLRHFPVLR